MEKMFVEVIDYLNAALALLSLAMAWFALQKARQLEALSISRSLVLEKLYELHVKLGRFGRGVAGPVEIADAINEVRDHHLLLEKAGLGRFLSPINEKAALFSELHRELNRIGIDAVTETQAADLTQRHNAMKAEFGALYQAMQPKLRNLFDSPFE